MQSPALPDFIMKFTLIFFLILKINLTQITHLPENRHFLKLRFKKILKTQVLVGFGKALAWDS